MITLHQGEEITGVIHKHWFTLIPQGMLIILLILFPLALPVVFRASLLPFDQDITTAFLRFAAALYFLIVSIIALTIWIDYYLDIWIITNSRIIDIEQHGLFNREISEIPIERVQDITTETTGIIQTLLHFGTIRIQTAGEREFHIKSIPHTDKVKELILNTQRLKAK